MSPRSIHSFTVSRNAAGSAVAGSRNRANADGAIIASHQRAKKFWPDNVMAGWSSWKRSDASPEFSMPDWNDELRKRLATTSLSPAREREIVEELSQHLEDQYERVLSRGLSQEEARREVL